MLRRQTQYTRLLTSFYVNITLIRFSTDTLLLFAPTTGQYTLQYTLQNSTSNYSFAFCLLLAWACMKAVCFQHRTFSLNKCTCTAPSCLQGCTGWQMLCVWPGSTQPCWSICLHGCCTHFLPCTCRATWQHLHRPWHTYKASLLWSDMPESCSPDV